MDCTDISSTIYASRGMSNFVADPRKQKWQRVLDERCKELKAHSEALIVWLFHWAVQHTMFYISSM